MKQTFKTIGHISCLCILSLTSCKNEAKKNIEPEAKPIKEVASLNLALMDTAVNPANNFFKYVNGKWLDTAVIPDDKSSWGSFAELRQNTDNDVLALLNAAIKSNPDQKNNKILPGSDQEKAVNLYRSIIDTTSRNAQGLAPLKPYLDKINAITNITQLENYLIEMQPLGGSGFFNFGVGANPKNSNMNVAFLVGAELGLPDRDYYVKNDADSKEKREKYVAFITKMLGYLGDTESDAAKQAKEILAFETRIAEQTMDKVEGRDARKRYNPKSISELKSMVPAINWDTYFKGIGVTKIDTIIVTDVNYIKNIQKILAENKVNDWKAYLRWGLLNNSASELTTALEKTNWEFYSKTLAGAQKQRPLDERALQTVNGSVGEALGKLYVDEYFPAEAKERAKKMIDYVVKAFGNRIQNVTWMSPETKEKALGKLHALKVKIAYPDKWRDYTDLKISTPNAQGSFFQNMLNVNQFNFDRSLKDLGNPVDKTRWGMSPQTVNAYFNPSVNEIVFPAAILQPPFFNFQADDAVNYGGIGAVIGHEISHCFDDSGARFDKDGNLNNWWTETDLKQFEALGKSLANQFSAIKVLPETYINGGFTLGENIGDLGGVNVALDALEMDLKENGNPGLIDGFTPEQRFFISWATIWRIKMRDDALKNQIKTDPHSPGMVRAVQPLLNVDAFYTAFNIKPTDSLYLKPEQRVKIW